MLQVPWLFVLPDRREGYGRQACEGWGSWPLPWLVECTGMGDVFCTDMLEDANPCEPAIIFNHANCCARQFEHVLMHMPLLEENSVTLKSENWTFQTILSSFSSFTILYHHFQFDHAVFCLIQSWLNNNVLKDWIATSNKQLFYGSEKYVYISMALT